MTETAKQTYYLKGGIPPDLANRYFRYFGAARRVLDVGCGIGDFGRYRPHDTVEVHGVDVDRGAIEQAKQYEIATRVDLESEQLPYQDGFFDAILAKDILEHLQHPERVVVDLYRVLRPGGVLIASVVMARPRRVWADYTHVRGFTSESAAMLLTDCGFRVEDVLPMGGVPLSGRLHFLDTVPHLLRIPPFAALWATSWEVRARKTG